MPIIQLNFPNPLNVSVQVGDVAYFSNPTEVGQPQEWTATTTPHLSNPQGGIIKIGEIVEIILWDGTTSAIRCDMPQALFNQYFSQIVAGECEDALDDGGELGAQDCPPGSFIMFSKDNKVNMSDMLGYYASVELRNSSTTEAELFNVGTTFFESSK